MDKIATPKRTKELISKYNFYFSKGLGQNFIIDQNILNKITSAVKITKDTEVLEVGPGIGSLTQSLAEAARRVVAVEIDQKLIPILKESLADYENVEVINKDILKVDLHKLLEEKFEGKEIVVVGNLPYYITTPIIMKFLEEKVPITAIVIMIQKEVADRMKAKAGTKDYGALSIAVQYYCDIENVMIVPPSVFIPQPKVDSSVIRLQLLEEPRVKVKREDLFFKVVKDAFGKRRKTLLNALSSGELGLSKELVRRILESCGINEMRRGETLSIEEFANLSNLLAEEL
ncbi:16S rRNA (adenine(1518)-N(6)/adenine(1519)-N(6))-dimethyltransferase RsmA [Alkaliphilus serpentinus]|uniref:Ribosomal RNA small subunit methyltransferase A n=1 Tax=Alkaliphilus serpentinus TaxID=1482731 RepID=A0A833HRE3_9FIRM|nr:16S rRNA (adenine(1518)-N(6)/adenine(1519)-N(6))-dimethyltransferase RsmA [Alkaliphilus serpentinus]KAB3531826.1 16S rRNA (adenine(1518)-N(6)/adenine(1519)-N(6))-dimethyltransferase RsmA [Alkaliphilus serpentinus]